MSKIITKQTGSFTAKTADGRNITIYIFTNFIEVATRGAGSQQVENLKSLRTANGEHVNRVEKGKYVTVESGRELTSDDPDAL
jgi:hypothetical protein